MVKGYKEHCWQNIQHLQNIKGDVKKNCPRFSVKVQGTGVGRWEIRPKIRTEIAGSHTIRPGERRCYGKCLGRGR